MQETIIEATRALPVHQEAFRHEFATGEYDMVVYDEPSGTCDIFEVPFCHTRHSAQRRHLTGDMCGTACRRVVAPIRRRVVLYRGKPGFEDGIYYENVENYLSGLDRRPRVR